MPKLFLKLRAVTTPHSFALRDSVNEFSPLLQSMQASAKEEILCYNFLPRYGRSCLDKTNHNNYHLVNMFDKYYSIRIVVR
jgi:hypothetical protein